MGEGEEEEEEGGGGFAVRDELRLVMGLSTEKPSRGSQLILLRLKEGRKEELWGPALLLEVRIISKVAAPAHVWIHSSHHIKDQARAHMPDYAVGRQVGRGGSRPHLALNGSTL